MSKTLRRERVLSLIDKEGLGLEIGPCHDPIAPKRDGYRVDIIDHASQADLRQKYKDAGIDLEVIEPVDYVWGGESYRELVGAEKKYDWVIASHVIEHVPDLVRFVNSCSEVLNDNGVLVLVVPDARYCFDQLRPISSLAAVIDAHEQGLTQHSAGSVVEFFLNASEKAGRQIWKPTTRGDNRLCNPQQQAAEVYRRAQSQPDYIDIHKWCFTPSSMRLIAADLSLLGLIDLQERHFSTNPGMAEFFIALSRNPGSQPPTDRLALLQAVQEEVAEPVLNRKRGWTRLFS